MSTQPSNPNDPREDEEIGLDQSEEVTRVEGDEAVLSDEVVADVEHGTDAVGARADLALKTAGESPEKDVMGILMAKSRDLQFDPETGVGAINNVDDAITVVDALVKANFDIEISDAGDKVIAQKDGKSFEFHVADQVMPQLAGRMVEAASEFLEKEIDVGKLEAAMKEVQDIAAEVNAAPTITAELEARFDKAIGVVTTMVTVDFMPALAAAADGSGGGWGFLDPIGDWFTNRWQELSVAGEGVSAAYKTLIVALYVAGTAGIWFVALSLVSFLVKGAVAGVGNKWWVDAANNRNQAEVIAALRRIDREAGSAQGVGATAVMRNRRLQPLVTVIDSNVREIMTTIGGHAGRGGMIANLRSSRGPTPDMSELMDEAESLQTIAGEMQGLIVDINAGNNVEANLDRIRQLTADIKGLLSSMTPGELQRMKLYLPKPFYYFTGALLVLFFLGRGMVKVGIIGDGPTPSGVTAPADTTPPEEDAPVIEGDGDGDGDAAPEEAAPEENDGSTDGEPPAENDGSTDTEGEKPKGGGTETGGKKEKPASTEGEEEPEDDGPEYEDPTKVQ